MINIEGIKEYLESQKRAFISDVRLRPSDESIMLYVSQHRVASKAKPGVTSARQLNNIKKGLAGKYSRKVEVILVQDDAQQALESGFYQILNRKFNDQIVSLYISFRDESVVDAFIEVSILTGQLQCEISEHFKTVLEDAELRLGTIQWLSSPSELPTLPALLRALKTLQPVNLYRLTIIIQKSYKSVSDKWLSHKLDQLRKKGLVIWQKDSETYVLTDKALGYIPAGTRRTSSDIERALALGRRKW